MKRREFIILLSGVASAWPLAARAQQPRRVGVLISFYSQTDREGQASIAAFLDTFQRLGWTDGRNVRIEYRWGDGDPERARTRRQNWSVQRPMRLWSRAVQPWSSFSG